VAITFDDGPDPQYTPRVLDILRDNGVKACFFVLGSKAEKYPDLLARIIAEGHDIGNHSQRHLFPWLLGPLGTIREIKKSAAIISNLAGHRPTMFRPPWGLINIFSFIFFALNSSSLNRQSLVLWSYMSWDWGKGASPEKISNRVLSQLRHGAILVFHDSDTVPGAARGAPEKMISALPAIISEILQKGLQITPLREMLQLQPLKKRLIIKIWGWWDSMILRLARIEQITADGRPTLFRVALRKYTGPAIEMPCGTILRQGNSICELHINNDMLADILAGVTKPDKIAVRLVREIRNSLPALAKFIANDPRFIDVQVLAGITMLHRATEKIGFVAADIPSGTLRRLIAIYQSIVLWVYHPAGRKRIAGQEGRLKPKIVAISKTDLLEKAAKWTAG
jgi:peptidoglycan/xylan/chitin deacetylase (PgdA/CDA1 family)